jgi:predicted molibdopterin-dependent oxidoreductase YjgC
MIKLRIDNREIEVRPGTSLIEAARENGINIPSLCYDKDLPHYTSCMLCMVKNVETGQFIPSCSAIAEKGMVIEASSEDVVDLRSKAISLLLTEHRAECEAPCRLVCPSGLNIPLMHRYVMKGDMDSARKLVYKELDNPESYCETCPKYCEKACRRRMIDQPIAISNIIKYLTESLKPEEKAALVKLEVQKQAKVSPKAKKRFNSTIGRMHESEKREWLKECPDNTKRISEPTSIEECIFEAENCMHCDCRAMEDCGLRQFAEEFSVKNPKRLRIGPPIEKKINYNNGLIFENAKCIKCGLCVRVSVDDMDNPSLCFTGRGFMSLISEPITNTFNSILKGGIDRAIDICPTGALARKD